MRYLFYMTTASAPAEIVDSHTLPDGYRWMLWKPTIHSLLPPGLKWWPYGRRTLFHYLHIFANRDYSVLIIYDGDTPVHCSFVVPRWFRFPFMRRDDLQIVATWTLPAHRGRGLATFALSRILKTFARRRLWYMAAKDNLPSIRVVKKFGFHLVGKGSRVNWLGSRLLGHFQIRDWTAGLAVFCDWLG